MDGDDDGDGDDGDVDDGDGDVDDADADDGDADYDDLGAGFGVPINCSQLDDEVDFDLGYS